jgi:predicted transcriptional regulator
MEKNKKISTKRTQVKVLETVDGITGELLDKKFQSLYWEREPDYIKMYLTDISRLYFLNLSQNKTLLALLRKMNYDCEIVLTSLTKKELIEALKLPKGTFNNSITYLIEKGIIMRIENNRYLVNPHLFARGSWSDIQKIQMTITYDKNGRLIKTNFFYDYHNEC